MSSHLRLAPAREAPPAGQPTGQIRVEIAGRVLDADALVQGSGATSMRVDGGVLDLWMEGAPPDVGVIALGLAALPRENLSRRLADLLSSKATRKLEPQPA